MSMWRRALQEIRWPLVTCVWVGTVVLAVLGILWLQIPDSHIWQFLFSILSACGLLALLFWLACWAFGQVFKPVEQVSWWLRWLPLAGIAVIWWLLQMPIDTLIDHQELYAGYWTSHLPHWLRGLHTYEHLLLLQSWVYFSLRLIVTGLLLPVALVAGTGALRTHIKQILKTLSQWWYWLPVLICGWIAFAISGKIMDWTPGHGLTGEITSLFFRLGFVFTFNVLLACFVLSVGAVGLRQGIAKSIE